MGTPSIEETKRNKEIYEDYTSKKYSQVDLVTKYRVSYQRIIQIAKRYEKKLNQAL